MGRACAYSIIATLVIAVHSSMAFTSNIHEKMTRAERFVVFGSEDSVPEYEVFSISLPGARSRREANKNINLEVEIEGRRIILDLKPTRGHLATKHTPVWSAERDERAYQKIRYEPLPRAMSDIGEFKMYHDVENEAAVTVYEDPDKGSVIEGIVLTYYAIRSLPKSLIKDLVKEPYFTKTVRWDKRSIISDTEKDKDYYVVYKVSTALKDVKSRSLVDPDNLRREKRARDKAGKQKVPKAVYPEILIVLDYTAMRISNLTEVLRLTLSFWNGVDLIYRALDKPKVHLNIAGIIIAGNRTSTPYIAKDPDIYRWLKGTDVLSEVGKYFYKERVRFPINRYDIIIAMTGMGLYKEENGHKIHGFGFTTPKVTACSSTRKLGKMKTVGSTGIIRYSWPISGVRSAVRTIAHLLGAKHEEINGTASDCAFGKGYIMSEQYRVDDRKMQWSGCSRRDFSRYFSSKKSMCLRNEPRWIKQAGEVLPGRWLTLDGQCRNEGYTKACKLKKYSTCAAKGCQGKRSRKCVRIKGAPLPGSKCGINQHCSTKKKCICD